MVGRIERASDAVSEAALNAQGEEVNDQSKHTHTHLLLDLHTSPGASRSAPITQARVHPSRNLLRQSLLATQAFRLWLEEGTQP